MKPDQQDVFFQLIVSGGGEFIYDAAGNLREAGVGQVTTDPVQGLTCPAGRSFWNGQGAILFLFSVANDALFLYRDLGTPVQGGLVFAAASAGGTDPVTGTIYTAGQTNIDPVFADSINVIGATIKLQQLLYSRQAQITANTGSGATSPFIQVDAPEQGVATHMQMKLQGTSPDGTHLGQVLIGQVAGGGALTPQTDGMLEVQAQVAAPADSVVQIINQGPAVTDNALGTRIVGDTNNRFRMNVDGQLRWGPGSAGQDVFLLRPAADQLQVLSGDLLIGTAGTGLRVKEGANAKQGVATLGAGTVVVANTSVTASSRIFLTAQDNNSTGALRVSARTPGTSFTITSSNAADSGVVAWEILEPA